MIVRCGWCGKQLDDSPGVDGEAGNPQQPVSHGICPDCQDNLAFQMGVDLHKYLDSLKTPVVLVDQSGSVVAANAVMLSVLGKESSDIHGFPGGDVFECAYARLPQGCGHTVHCSGCTVRRAVMRTFETGISEIRTPAVLIRDNDGIPEQYDLAISTEKVGDKVLLQIDAMCPA